MPNILVTNDDGIDSLTLHNTVRTLSGLGEVWVLVPDCDRSGTSHLLTLSRPIRVTNLSDLTKIRWYSCSGTPADCAYLGICGVFGGVNFDLLVSGINNGLNVADAIPYSGTVAAACEASLLDIPSIAVSVEDLGISTMKIAENVLHVLATHILERHIELPIGTFLNVNVPTDALEKFAVTTIGRRPFGKEIVKVSDPKGRDYWWIGGSPLQTDLQCNTDCWATIDEKVTSVSLCSCLGQRVDDIDWLNTNQLGLLTRLA